MDFFYSWEMLIISLAVSVFFKRVKWVYSTEYSNDRHCSIDNNINPLTILLTRVQILSYCFSVFVFVHARRYKINSKQFIIILNCFFRKSESLCICFRSNCNSLQMAIVAAL